MYIDMGEHTDVPGGIRMHLTTSYQALRQQVRVTMVTSAQLKVIDANELSNQA